MKPDFNLTLDGTRLDGETKGAVSGVRVFLTHSGASAFEIVVDDPELRWQAKPTFTECKEVQIELGLPGKMKKIFDGEVTAWRTELERTGPTVLVLRGMDRSHRLMRGHKTKTYAEASPLDCARQIASAAGLTAKTSAGQPAPVKTFRIQANESDFSFLRKMADLEGYLFYVEGSDLHFERPKLSSKDDLAVTFGEDLKTFLPVANFRRPAAKVEVGGWDSAGKAALLSNRRSTIMEPPSTMCGKVSRVSRPISSCTILRGRFLHSAKESPVTRGRCGGFSNTRRCRSIEKFISW